MFESMSSLLLQMYSQAALIAFVYLLIYFFSIATNINSIKGE